MVWFKIDDAFHGHPKIVKAGNAACGLFVRLGSYCSQHGTDGVIPNAIAHAYGTRTELRKLSDLELIVPHSDGWLIPDFLDFNPSAAEVEAKRIARSEAGKLGGVKSGQTRKAKANGEANASAVLHTSGEAKTDPVPVPSRTTSSSTDDYLSSVSQGTDDDSYQQVIGLIVDGKEREWGDRIDKRKLRAWRHKVHMNTHVEDGDVIRSRLAEGQDAEHVALEILGYGHSAAQERMETAWCASDCPHGCEGDGWTRTDEGFAPCPGRAQ